MKFVYLRYLNYIFHLGYTDSTLTPGWVSCTGDRPLARGYFRVRTAAATAAVVAQQLRQHPWLGAVDKSVDESVGFATS